jgi:hypothetical protein
MPQKVIEVSEEETENQEETEKTEREDKERKINLNGTQSPSSVDSSNQEKLTTSLISSDSPFQSRRQKS